MLNVDGKDFFPHNFMNKNNLFYEGKVPDIKYYNKISTEEYNNLLHKCNNVWNAKNNCLTYLEKDLDLLYDALIIFGKEIWNDYGVNITSRKTISGLTLLIFQVNFLKKCGYKIPIVNGPLEKYSSLSEEKSIRIRGLTQIYAHKCDKAFHYDMTSQYPTAMCEMLPVGNVAKIKSVDNIDSCFGIIYADIVSPTIEELRVPLIPRKLPSGEIDVPHNAKWSGWYSTIDLQTAVANKYKVYPKVGVHFEKGTPFKSFINDIFPKKVESKEKKEFVKTMIYKLLLNTLYGRMGMRTEFYSAKIVKKSDVAKIVKYNTWSVMNDYSNTDYMLIKTGKYIDSKLIEIIKDNDENAPTLKIDQRKRGTLSSIPMAVTITAIARQLISVYKNIPNNPMVYSDTDSVILPKPLSKDDVGKELGKIKLENIIKEGIFIGKKLYA